MIGDGRETEQPFLYDAFISYRHVERDRLWAQWLIEALERYRVPKTLQQQGLPPRLRKIFRDEDEVPASADLDDQIKEALIASRFLIVVCSAFTPRSRWVAREIEIFNELGRGDQVLALLTEGEPADSFPNPLLVRLRKVIEPDGAVRIVEEAKEPLAADVRPRKGQSDAQLKRFALLRLVAVILGVKFDDLRLREQERARKRRLALAAVVAAAVMLIGVGGLGYWDMNRPKTTYYRQLVWRFGLPEGLWEVDAQTHGHLARSYSVVTQGGRVSEVRHDGWVHAEADGFARWVVHYRDDGTPERIDRFDATGRLAREDVLRRESAGEKLIVTFERDNIPVTQAATQNLIIDSSQWGNGAAQAKSEITRHEVRFDDKGFPIEVRYQDNWGAPRRDAQGSFGEHFAYSPDGLVLRSAEIGPDGEEMTLKNGVRAVTFAYDRDRGLVRHTLLGEDGRPFNGPDGYAYYIRGFDRWGNYDAQTYYDAEGRPTTNRQGYSKFSGEHDERGENTEFAVYDVDGHPTLSKEGWASFHRKFDARGDAIEEEYLGVDGEPKLTAGGFAVYRQAFDASGHRIEIAYLGADGKPIIANEGFAKVTFAFDPRGNEIARAYFGVDGKPTLNSDGVAENKFVYDARGNVTEVAYLGVDGKLKLDNAGIARGVLSYDGRGNLTETAFFGVDGKLTSVANGFAVSRQAFDERGNRIELAYFDVERKPTLNKEGIARVAFAFDAHGNEIERDFFGVDGAPVLTKDGVARITYAYDARGDNIERAFSDAAGKPTLHKDGFARVVFEYDNLGRVAGATYFDVQNRLVAMEPVVLAVFPGSAAERIGLMVGDRIIRYRGKTPSSVEQFVDWVTDLSGAASRTLVVGRGSQTIAFEVAPGRLGVSLDMARSGRAADASAQSPALMPPMVQAP